MVQVFLDVHNPIVLDCITSRASGGIREACEVTASDLDSVAYKVEVAPDKLDELLLSVSLPFYQDIISQGGALPPQHASLLTPSPAAGFDLTLRVDLDAVAQDPTMAQSLAETKRNLIGSLFDKAFTALNDGSARSLGIMTLHWRPNETVYIIPSSDRVTVIYAIDFVEPEERALAKVFLNEFADTQRTVNNAPPCSFSPEPPGELAGMQIKERNCVGYISFVMFPQHVAPGQKETCISLLCGFRNYLHYHIKCTKTYMLMRMRKRVVSLLQVLNRAKPEEEKAQKTAQGKRFSRK